VTACGRHGLHPVPLSAAALQHLQVSCEALQLVEIRCLLLAAKCTLFPAAGLVMHPYPSGVWRCTPCDTHNKHSYMSFKATWKAWPYILCCLARHGAHLLNTHANLKPGVKLVTPLCHQILVYKYVHVSKSCNCAGPKFTRNKLYSSRVSKCSDGS